LSGINAQMSVPIEYFEGKFVDDLMAILPQLDRHRIFSYHTAPYGSTDNAFTETTSLRLRVKSALVVDKLDVGFVVVFTPEVHPDGLNIWK
jgi:hypothetical protein